MRYLKRCFGKMYHLYSTFGHCIYFGLHYFDLIRLMDFLNFINDPISHVLLLILVHVQLLSCLFF